MRFLIISPHEAGFFSMFNGAVGGLYLAQNKTKDFEIFYDRIPLVFWGNCYYSSPGINVWESYFEQLSDYSIYDITQKTHDELIYLFSTASSKHEIVGENDIYYNSNYVGLPIGYTFYENRSKHDINLIKAHSKIACEIIKPKKEILDYVNKFYEKHMLNKHVVGIHYRGTDKEREIISYLKVTQDRDDIMGVEVFVAEAKKLKADCYFVATDCAKAMEYIKNNLPNVVSNDFTRSINNKPIHDFGCGVELGKEVLIDCLLLSKCNHILHGFSNIPQTAFLFNPNLTGKSII